MDEVRDRMAQFEAELSGFQESLRSSIQDLHQHHDRVSPLWQDEMRRDYDARWLPLEEAMDEYIRRIGPEQVETMLTKLRHLEGFLRGH
jgi:hypothetical protein